jgi:hypothetical protein
MGRWGTNVVFGVLLVAGLALAVFGALIASGRYVHEPSVDGSSTPPTATSTRSSVPPPPAKQVVSMPSTASTTTRAAGVVITITASRGNCWVNARRGSSTGPRLAYELLAKGKTLTLRGERIWLQLGAASSVDVTVNGRAHPVPSATAGFVLG